MRAVLALAALASALAAPALAEQDPFGTAQPTNSLESLRGGTDTGPTVVGSVLQGNATDQTSSNTGSIAVSRGASMENGAISAATVSANSGVTTVMQNTGNLVNLSNSTSVNVYMR